MKTYLILLGFSGLTACASAQNSLIDATTFEGDQPVELREARGWPNQMVAAAVHTNAANAFEMARRYERGLNGYPADLVCAHTLYARAGQTLFRTTTNVNGFPVQETYFGLPHGRLAARRLERTGVRSDDGEDLERCFVAAPTTGP